MMFNFKLRTGVQQAEGDGQLGSSLAATQPAQVSCGPHLLDNMKLQLVHKVMFDFIVREVYSELRVMNNLVLFVRRELNNKVQMTDALYQNKLLEIFTSLRLKMYHRTKDLLLKR